MVYSTLVAHLLAHCVLYVFCLGEDLLRRAVVSIMLLSNHIRTNLIKYSYLFQAQSFLFLCFSINKVLRHVILCEPVEGQWDHGNYLLTKHSFFFLL